MEQWTTRIGPVQPYVLADLFGWLETHSDHLHEGTAIPHILPISSNRILNTKATSYSSNK